MGEDKSLLNSNVERLSKELEASGCERVIVMCGSGDRADLFPGECHIDTKDTPVSYTHLTLPTTIEV